ncbi:gamma-glutamyltransferase, partial [Arthrospira platensis SPKY1]|nr:gamma-glutamyltransferase [Arthrospira platensis SPKY1]
LVDGQPPEVGHILRQARLGDTLARLASAGLDDFYRGALGREMGDELAALGSPLTADDLAAYHAQVVEPLEVRVGNANLYNLPPPTQGLASLMILGIFSRLGVQDAEGFDHLHGLVESTKRAFRVRDRVVTDPGRLPAEPHDFLTDTALAARAGEIDPAKALPWPDPAAP